MLAVRMYGKDDIRIEEVPTPKPQKGEILLKVKAAAICGTDVRMIKNGARGIDSENPLILGHEFAGVIEEVGEGVTGYEKGERVAVAPNMGCGICNLCVSGKGHLCSDYKAFGISIDGAFSEYCLIPESAVRGGNLSKLSECVSFEEGAVNEPLSCVCNGFEHADIHPGDRVLVIGAGPIGIMHCAMALMAGAVVYLNDLSVERLEIAKKLYPKINLVKGDLKSEFMNLTCGYGADAIITACPSPAVQTLSLELASVGARIIMFGGVPADKQPVGIDTNIIHYKQLIVSGTTRASLTQYRKTLSYISSGVLDVTPIISRRFALSDFSKAYELASRADGLKNVIIFE